jgi:hypothetical protein
MNNIEKALGKKAYTSMMAQENQVLLKLEHMPPAPTSDAVSCVESDACGFAHTCTQVISDTDAADARYCGGAMTGGTGWYVYVRACKHQTHCAVSIQPRPFLFVSLRACLDVCVSCI